MTETSPSPRPHRRGVAGRSRTGSPTPRTPDGRVAPAPRRPLDPGGAAPAPGRGGRRSRLPVRRLSVVIVNYNYGQFVGAAIESALALRWDDLEVVVVDDGSTDDSRAVIERYADRARVLFTENGSQRVGANHGFGLTSGDVVVFLDSDDVLPADLPLHLAARWTPLVSKAQFRMQRIDAVGRPLGAPFPDYGSRVPSPNRIRTWAARTAAYPTPPGSGNAYSRWFLERVLPAGPELGGASDSALLAAAPFLGDVVTVPEVVVGYRRHGANDSFLLGDPTRFTREVARARARWHFACGLRGRPPGAPHDAELFRGRELLQLRIAAHRRCGQRPALPGDRAARMLLDALRAPFQVGPEPIGRRLLISAWCLATLIAPDRLARRLLAARYGR